MAEMKTALALQNAVLAKLLKQVQNKTPSVTQTAPEQPAAQTVNQPALQQPAASSITTMANHGRHSRLDFDPAVLTFLGTANNAQTQYLLARMMQHSK